MSVLALSLVSSLLGVKAVLLYVLVSRVPYSPVFGVVLHSARVQEELDAARVALGGRQVKSGAAVVVAEVHVHALLVRAARGQHNIV